MMTRRDFFAGFMFWRKPAVTAGMRALPFFRSGELLSSGALNAIVERINALTSKLK